MTVMTSTKKSPQAQGLPHSWSIDEWPPAVYPGSGAKARYVIRVHKLDLVQAGALVRVGRGLVVLGARYARWLELKAADVPGYECPVSRWKSAQRVQETRAEEGS
jgi:hypothetical protein